MASLTEHLASAVASLVGHGGLPGTLPESPVRMFRDWLEDAAASGKYDDPNAMVLATSTPDGRPSARVVLCKQIDDQPPSIVFFTNYQSRKGDELTRNPHAACVMHWPHAQRQVRIEGRTELLDSAASDAYFASRALLSKLGAWASHQSQPLQSRGQLVQQVAAEAARHGVDMLSAGSARIPRPPHWGGFRLVIERLELWQGVQGRLHDRAVWTRRGDGWESTRLQP
jgi:pyridoxamine 5'-phosphate oxidase